MLKSYPTFQVLLTAQGETYALLDEVGLPYKHVSRFELADEAGAAVWTGESEETGFITIYRGCDPEAVAHELGHGFHEALNQHRRVTLPAPFRYPEDGEAVAEAVRFFVEQRRGSSWRPTRDLKTLEHCHYDFEEFKGAVQALVR